MSARATTGLVRRVAPGDTIWLISQRLPPWQRLPPSLDARIDVAACEPTPAGYRFMAAETSRWYPLAMPPRCCQPWPRGDKTAG